MLLVFCQHSGDLKRFCLLVISISGFTAAHYIVKEAEKYMKIMYTHPVSLLKHSLRSTGHQHPHANSGLRLLQSRLFFLAPFWFQVRTWRVGLTLKGKSDPDPPPPQNLLDRWFLARTPAVLCQGSGPTKSCCALRWEINRGKITQLPKVSGVISLCSAMVESQISACRSLMCYNTGQSCVYFLFLFFNIIQTT